jgi:L-amino acid N-acyltransferase YncA
MDYNFEQMSPEHEKQVMEIFNYYIENSFAAYPESKLPDQFYVKFLEIAQAYPSYVIKKENNVIGFCLLRPYNPFPVFKETAEVTYFIHKDYTGNGLGVMALKKLEDSAKQKNIRKLIADISSENIRSINFHKKNGFKECGTFHNAGKKFNKSFSVVWMEKDL